MIPGAAQPTFVGYPAQPAWPLHEVDVVGPDAVEQAADHLLRNVGPQGRVRLVGMEVEVEAEESVPAGEGGVGGGSGEGGGEGGRRGGGRCGLGRSRRIFTGGDRYGGD